MKFTAILAAAWLLAGTLAVSYAQPAPPPRRDAARGAAADTGSPTRLPPDAVTHHTLDLPGRSLAFTATAGSFDLDDNEGKPQARITFYAYVLDGADPQTRPVTFVTNGGPGYASAWLQMGALGPWRVPMDGAARSPSALPIPIPNDATWLDFTDLVFIDPAGTGYSRLLNTEEAARRRVWSVPGDISLLAETVRRWLVASQRLTSPKFFAGESYGGFRGPRLTRALADQQGVGLSGLVLISPLLDAAVGAYAPLDDAASLPSMAAIAHHLASDGLGEVEAFAMGDYLHFLMADARDDAAVARISTAVASYTGLDPALVREHRGRVQTSLFLHQHAPGEIASAYDGTLTSPDPFPEAAFFYGRDIGLEQFSPMVSSAMADLITTKLNWHPQEGYRLFNQQAFQQWDWGRGMQRAESMSALRNSLALDPRFRVLIGQGVDDLVIPYFSTKLLLAELPTADMAARVTLALHDGGHMFYTRDASRLALHDEARALETAQ